MRNSRLILISFGALAAFPIYAQKPVIAPGGVVNGASFAPVSGPGHALAPGGIASIFGENLAASKVQTSAPLPTTLAGTSVTVNGVPAPLFYVSPGQIDIQVPASSDMGSDTAYGRASIVVTTAEGTSDPVMADTFKAVPGIFTVDGTGCGQGAVMNVKPDGTKSLNSPSNSASPGDYLEIYATGGGLASHAPADGAVAPAVPLAQDINCCSVVLNFVDAIGVLPAPGVVFFGKAPGLVGVDQINTAVPAQFFYGAVPLPVPEGCAVPLQLFTLKALSQPVTVSIHSGGGQCVDPPIASAGQLILKKSVVLNDNTIPESDTFTASFNAAPGKTILPSIGSTRTTLQQGTTCTIPGYSSMSAGAITLTSPEGNSIQAQPSLVDGNVTYQAILPPGWVHPGAYKISSNGGPDIGAFQTTLSVGSEIHVTSQFPQDLLQGTGGIPGSFNVFWTGGQAGEVVTLKIVGHGLMSDELQAVQAPATSGTISVRLITVAGSSLEIDFEVGPDPSQPQTISASGLTLGAQVRWVYEYRFVGLP